MSAANHKQADAWALQFKHWDRPTLVGVYYFTEHCAPWHDGMRTVLFRTRREARAAAGYLRVHRATSATPVRVRVWLEFHA